MIERDVDFISSKKEKLLFWGIAVFYLIVWTFLPSILQPGYRLDVIEMIFVGKEMVIGYHKHPALPTWIAYFFHAITNRADYAPFLASQVCIMICFWGTWRIGRMLFSRQLALLGTFAMGGYWFYAYDSTQFNHHTPLMALSVLTCYFLYCAFQTNQYRWWVATGFVIGLGMHSKYTMIFLAIAILVFMFFNSEARKFWKTPGPYLTVIFSFLVFLPNLIWVIQNNFSVVTYASKLLRHTYWTRLLEPLEFSGGQLLLLLPILLILLPLTAIPWRRKKLTQQEHFSFWFLFTLIFIPFFLYLFTSLVFEMNLSPTFGSQIWPLFGIFWLYGIREPLSLPKLRLSWCLCLCGMGVMIIALVVACLVVPHLRNRPTRFLFPIEELAQKSDDAWKTYYEIPCPYVAGEWWLAGNAALRMKDEPTVHAYGDPDSFSTNQKLSSWSTDESVCSKGGMIFWEVDAELSPNGVPPNLYERFPTAVCLPMVTLVHPRGMSFPPVYVGMAIVPVPHKESLQPFPDQKVLVENYRHFYPIAVERKN